MTVLTAATLVLAGGAPARAAASAADDTEPLLTLEIAQAAGSGCTRDNTRVTVHPDNGAFDLWIDGFEARNGPGASPTDFRKNCGLRLLATARAGFSYGITEVTQTGRASIAKGAAAQHHSSLYWCGCSGAGSDFRTNYKGPLYGSWTVVSTPDWIRYSSCTTRTEMTNVLQELRVNAGSSGPETANRMSLGGDDKPAATYRLDWRTC